MLAIETDDLRKSYGSQVAVRDVSLAVPEGAVCGFLGPNGSGKTTTMRIILGLARPDRGIVRLFGREMRTQRTAALSGVGSLIETASLYEHLTGRQNLRIAARLLRHSDRSVEEVLSIVDLHHAADRKAKTYSLGMKQRLALARALLGRPRLLVLDEPTNGLDPDGIAQMSDLIRDLPRTRACTVLVSSHSLADVERMADHIAVMRDGSLTTMGRVDKLLNGSHTTIFEVNEARRSESILSELPLTCQLKNDTTIIVECGRSGREQIAAANDALVANGIRVYGIQPGRQSLIDIYKAGQGLEETSA